MRLEFEPPSFCCQKGKIRLRNVELSEELYELYTSNSKEAEEFRKHIRAYNSIFSFTSFGARLDKELASSKQGVYTFIVQGQIYHHLPALIPEANAPRYLQLYFYDTENELNNRLNILKDVNLNERIVKKLMEILEENPFARFLRKLKDYPSLDNLQVCIKKDVSLDQRVYNSSTADQVAAIWIESNDPSENVQRDIIVHAHSGAPYRVKHYYGCYDPLQYPILFPGGEIGWHQNIKKTNDVVKGTIRQHNDPNEINPNFSSLEDIFNQEQEELSDDTVVEMYIKLETTRLDFYRRKQGEIRAELYQGIVDSVMAGETSGSQVGQ
nr:uncharacterized protein LOC113737757 [Coffea arabica]